jgi:hypothetical protein
VRLCAVWVWVSLKLINVTSMYLKPGSIRVWTNPDTARPGGITLGKSMLSKRARIRLFSSGAQEKRFM